MDFLRCVFFWMRPWRARLEGGACAVVHSAAGGIDGMFTRDAHREDEFGGLVRSSQPSIVDVGSASGSGLT
ncbi:MAG: hypothetical protein OXF88_13465 [Rhodobacteraceae bacterium]|nr:hypothetical protein [Paracoccaceae bacterium]